MEDAGYVFVDGRPNGGWTRKLNLGDGRVSFEDMISPEFFELEREAIFRLGSTNEVDRIRFTLTV